MDGWMDGDSWYEQRKEGRKEVRKKERKKGDVEFFSFSFERVKMVGEMDGLSSLCMLTELLTGFSRLSLDACMWCFELKYA